MNPKRGLIGLFILTFLLSTIGMITLTLDDKKDLSSQASIGVQSQKQKALGEVSLISNDSIWDGSLAGYQYRISYDKNTWQAPSGKESVFTHRTGTTTARVGTIANLTENKLGFLLGENFIYSQSVSVPNTKLQYWTVKGFVYQFLGQDKYVDLWTNNVDLAVLIVTNNISTRQDVESLLLGISTIDLSKNVKGTSTSLDDSARLAALVRPSVSMILTSYCARVKLSNTAGSMLSGKEYPFCLAATGTGFFVNPDGYLATNGHVVIIDNTEALIAGVTTGQLENLLIDLTEESLKLTGVHTSRELAVKKVKESMSSKESTMQYSSAVVDLKTKGYLNIIGEDYKYFVQVGSTPIRIDKTLGVNVGKDILEAKMVDFDYKENNPLTGFSSSDVALLKVEGNNFPALPLGKIEDVTVGSNLQVIGFPGIAGGSNSLLLDSSANAEPTLTRGVVSALKKAKGDQKNLIQTDASINHGNSGGPAINSSGQVIGIATYGLTPKDGSGNYNFLRDITDLKVLMDKNNVVAITGQTYDSWNSGLENYWHSYYKYAQKDFSKIQEQYPIHPTVLAYLDQTITKKGTAEDRTPLFTRTQRKQYQTIAGVVMAISLIAIIVLFILDKTSSRNKRAIAIASLSSSQQTQSIQPIQNTNSTQSAIVTPPSNAPPPVQPINN